MVRFPVLLPLVAAGLVALSCKGREPVPDTGGISIFCDHIETVAAQEGVSFAKAAAMVRDIGYTGVDIRVNQSPSEIRTLDSLGFAHACAIVDIDYSAGDNSKLEKKSLSFMKKRGFRRLLLVPGLLPEGAGEEEVAIVRERIASFVERAASKGFEVMVEDYDNKRSSCYNSSLLDGLFDASDNLGMVFDSGNFLFCGEDAYRSVMHFSDRIGHVHLKDRRSGDDLSCVPAGTGCIPMYAIIQYLLSKGYKGWFTVEQFGSRSMLSDSRTSFKNVSGFISDTKPVPGMTEYYYPAVKTVDASSFTPSPIVPDGATVLFDGKDLSSWRSSDGSPARWTVNPDKSMTVNKKTGSIQTADSFGSYELHVEWKVPVGIEGSGQGRGNSGVYLNGAYEVQVLDSYGNETYVDGQAASIYKQSVPSANPCKAPGQWNCYDIVFHAPVLDAGGSLVSRPRVTVVFNGVTVQDDIEIFGTTEYIGFPQEKWAVTGPIILQSHRDRSQPISFRNIWIRSLD